jgi:hypothetical protein
MSLDTSSRPRIQQVIEALAAACGLEQPEMPSEAPGLVLESAEGFLTLILPHPEDSTRLTVDIGRRARRAEPLAVRAERRRSVRVVGCF